MPFDVGDTMQAHHSSSPLASVSDRSSWYRPWDTSRTVAAVEGLGVPKALERRTQAVSAMQTSEEETARARWVMGTGPALERTTQHLWGGTMMPSLISMMGNSTGEKCCACGAVVAAADDDGTAPQPWYHLAH